MGTMVKMYIHVLLVDIHESPLFRKCESDFINKTIKCSNALLISDIIRPSIVRPVKRDWAVLSKDTPMDISISKSVRQGVFIHL